MQVDLEEAIAGHLKIDPEFRSRLMPLTDEEKASLEQNLIEDGCQDAIKVWNGTIIDGHNRYEICEKLGISYDLKEVEFDDREAALEWIDRNQLGRRNLTDAQRTLVLGRVYNRTKQGRGATDGFRGNQHSEVKHQNDALAKTSKRVADEQGVSQATVERAGALADAYDNRATPELKKAFDEGKVKKGEFTKLADLPPEEQSNVVALPTPERKKLTSLPAMPKTEKPLSPAQMAKADPNYVKGKGLPEYWSDAIVPVHDAGNINNVFRELSFSQIVECSSDPLLVGQYRDTLKECVSNLSKLLEELNTIEGEEDGE